MLDRSAQLATRYVRTHEAARLLGISPRTLEKYRCHGSGPTFRKLGGRVVYAIDELEAWAERGTVASTSDPRGSVLPALPGNRQHYPAPGRPAR